MNKRIALFLFTAVFVILYFSYKTDVLYSKISQQLNSFGKPGWVVLDAFNAIGNELDITKGFRERAYNFEASDINLSLKRSIVTHLENISNDSLTEGFGRDDKNSWKPTKLSYGSLDESRASIKIHGTSASPLNQSLGLWSHFKNLVNIGHNSFDLSSGGASFNIKLKSKEQYLNGVRRLVLLSSFDDWTIASNSLNRYAASQGLITSHGELKNLFINGRPVGLYLAYENINRELLERNYRITNYGEYKSNNVWDKSLGGGHISLTDYSIYDQEQDGMDEVHPIGLRKLEDLFFYIEKGNVALTKSLVDIDNMALVAAFEKLYGTDHSSIGDNRRYYYDPTIGKFRVSFRIEGAPVKLESRGVAYFESSSAYWGGDQLLNLLQTDQNFLDLRNHKLLELLKAKDDIVSMVREDLIKFKPILNRSVRSTREIEYRVNQDIFTLKHNFDKIDEYLSYGRVLASLRIFEDKNQLEILNDSYTSSSLHSYRDCSGKSHSFDVELEPASLPTNDAAIIEANKTVISVPSTCITDMTVLKNGKNVDSRDIFINVINEERPPLSFKDAIVGDYTIDKVQSLMVLKEGLVKVLNTFQLPRGMALLIEPGVLIEIADGASMIVRGDLIAEGTVALPITIRPEQGGRFGSVAVLGEPIDPLTVRLKHFNISGGGESWVDGVLFTGQLAMHRTIFSGRNIKVSDSGSDDGLNVKNSTVFIEDSHFFNNLGDQIDLDFVTGEVTGSLFNRSDRANMSDGLDVSGSNILVFDNVFQNFGDKGLSIGEQSELLVVANKFLNNEQGIAVKDASTACVVNNELIDNNKDVIGYVKKKMYSEPLYDVRYDSQAPKSLADIRSYEGCNFD